MEETPYHAGERRVQARLGETEAAARNGRIVGERIPEGALGFVAQQNLVILASLDDEGRPWASALIGPRGFAVATHPRTVEIDLARICRQPQDPLWTNLRRDPRVGCLFIELATRRRLRINGHVLSEPRTSLQIAVEEAYANCRKYVQRRQLIWNDTAGSPAASPPSRGSQLQARQRDWIATADTLFVASAHSERGADASHRGGNPGFVEILDERTLLIPDYPGNSMYNTLGNLETHPVAGLLFLDFERRATLQVVGRVEILWHLDRPSAETAGTQRYWTLTVNDWLESELPDALAWTFLDFSPQNPTQQRR